MHQGSASISTTSGFGRCFLLVFLMLLMPLTPLAAIQKASADESSNSIAWAKTGYNDTGWVLLDASGADPSTGQPAITDWALDFAPGAEIDNLTFEVRVDGSDGVSILEPKLYSPDTADILFDWQGHGTFGAADDFDSGNPHTGRLAPNTDSGAMWTLPAGAEIDSLIFEALSPLDPVVSFEPVELDFTEAVFHPVDGRMYASIGDVILVIDANSNPYVIDIIEPVEDSFVMDIEIDVNSNRLLAVTESDGIYSYSLADGSDLGVLPANPITDTPLTNVLSIGGDLWGTSSAGLFKMNSASTGWTQERISGSSNWPDGEPVTMMELNGIIHVSIWDGGVARWDPQINAPLSVWSTANNLHSDMITSFHVEGTQLLMASPDAGVGRYDHQGGFWLAAWSNANWLASNEVHGIASASGTLFVLAGDTTHVYDTAVGAFTNSHTIDNFGLYREGLDLMSWPSSGSRSPSSPWVLVGDGNGNLAVLDPTATPLHSKSILILSGPSGQDMRDVIEVGNIVWVAVGENVDRFDLTNNRWLEPIPLGDTAIKLVAYGNTVWAGTDGGGIHEIDGASATVNRTFTTSDGLSSDEVNGMAIDDTGMTLVAIHPDSGVVVIDLASGSVSSSFSTDTGLGTNFMRDVAIKDGIAYIATDGRGLARLNLSSNSLLSAWTSTGVDDVDYIPVEQAGNILLIGLHGYGVVRKNMQTGEYLDAWTYNRNGGGLPNNEVMSLHADANGNVWIGTQNGLTQWDGSHFNAAGGGTGGGWNNPTQFFDLTSDSSSLYAATNAGVCEYDLSSRARQDCWNTQDGMPYNWVRTVEMFGSYVFAGTWQGVGVINVSSGSVEWTWEAGGDTGNAVVEVIGDIAYIAFYGMGIARYDLSTGEWLNWWTEGNGGLLDTDEITCMAIDRNPNQLWVGGTDGFQLLDVVNETEEVDIEKSSNVFSGNGDPIEIVIAGNVLYYISYYYFGDNVYRIDLDNMTSLSNLDAGAQVGISGYMYGIGLVNGVLNIGVNSWGDSAEGAVARYDTTSKQWDTTWEATGSVERLTSYESSATGHIWVAWGSVKIDEFDSNGNLLNSWDSGFDFPVREILEYDGELLFATDDGIARYDENQSQWLTTWTPGNGLPNQAEDRVYDLYVDGGDLWVGTGDTNWWGNPQNPRISLLDSGGTWATWNGGQGNIPNGFPISFTLCDGIIHVAMSNNQNGGVARYDGSNWLSSFAQNSGLSNDAPSAVTCDDQDTLYVAQYENGFGVDRFSYQTGHWLSTLDNSNSGISEDTVFWDSINWDNGQLIIGHTYGSGANGGVGGSTSVGGVSLLGARGNSHGQASVFSIGATVSDVDMFSVGWAISTAGSSSGYSHLDILNQNGLNTLADLPGLVDGRVVESIGNSTHVWVVTANAQTTGQGILQGRVLPNGTVEWEYGWPSWGGSIEEIYLKDDLIYASIAQRGVGVFDTNTGASTLLTGALHNTPDGLQMWGDDLVIGLQGTWASSAGIQVFNTSTMSWDQGSLISGLPSNYINDFAVSLNHLYIATDGGVARWNLTAQDWDNPLTTMDGLTSNNVNNLFMTFAMSGQTYTNDILYMSTPMGVERWDVPNDAPLSTLTRNQGLVGDNSRTLFFWSQSAVGGQQGTGYLMVAHDGAGSTRPGITQVSLGSVYGSTSPAGTILDIHRPDQIPHNTVTAVATDWWGVHIATPSDPITHWNSSSNQFEDGATSWQTPSWPIYDMDSDGSDLWATGTDGAVRIDATGNIHQVRAAYPVDDSRSVCLGANGFWLVAESGLYGWEPAPTYGEMERLMIRRAIPLNVGFVGNNQNVSEFTHPGASITFIDSSNSVVLDPSLGVPGPNGILMQASALSLSSPVDNAATWVRSTGLTYSGTWDLNDTDPGLQSTLQKAISSGSLNDGSRQVVLRLQSPENGSMWARITYDWIRTETPIDMVDIWDRPDDGGGVLTAEWTMVQDETFNRYLVFAHESPWLNPPAQTADLIGVTPDASISLYSRVSADLSTAQGLPMMDGTDYEALVVVEYADGSFGSPSVPIGPATPSDEVPAAPVWGVAGPSDGGAIGDLYVEWGRCTALDLASTNIYASSTSVTDAIALPLESSVDVTSGNSTILQLEPGKPVWLALTCMDEAGQEDRANALIIGPVVPTGGINDGVPPPRIEGVEAGDVPDDEGGRIYVNWEPSIAEDCAFTTIYMLEVNADVAVDDDGVPFNVDEFLAAAVIPDCTSNTTVVDMFDNMPLVDGRPYWIGVVASDDWLNEDKGDVNIVTATPFRNLVGTSTPPDRIGSIEAWDHPDDDGKAVDVRWTPSGADDFAYYVIWAGAFEMDDIEAAWNEFGPDGARCGCVRVDKQWIVDSGTPMEVTLSQALYPLDDGDVNPEDGYVEIIRPDEEIQVTISVHDIKGNVHLTDLETVDVTPVDNSQDDLAPERIGSLLLYDFPLDDGTRLLMQFSRSTASDIDHYEVYAATWDFDTVGVGTNGPDHAVMTLDRNHDQPIMITELNQGNPVLPNVPVTVAVVAYDTSGNAHLDDLNTATSAAEDNGVSDPGSHLPDIEDVSVLYIDDGDAIIVGWTHSSDPAVEGYRIYIGGQNFDESGEVSDATMLGMVAASNSFRIDPTMFSGYDNSSIWWIGISAVDDLTFRHEITPTKLNPYSSDSGNNGSGGAGQSQGEEKKVLEEMLEPTNLLIIALLLAILLVMVLLVRGRGAGRRKNAMWELQEATWGIGDDGWGAGFDPLAAPAPTSSAPVAPAAVTNPEIASTVFAAERTMKVQPEIPVLQPASAQQAYQPATQPVSNELVGDLGSTSKDPNAVDTSFLDDLL